MGVVGSRTKVAVAGSTGSIGAQALEVIQAAPERFDVVALGAQRSVELLASQAALVHPAVVVVVDEAMRPELERRVPPGTRVLAGPAALADACAEADVVVNGVVGFAGLPVTLATLDAGRRLALANKESLIAAGPLVARALARSGGEIVPVDSEHCAVHQCLRALDLGKDDRALKRIILTASGGPFLGRSLQELAEVSVADALDHPTWKMGPMNTVNSSTLLNKGLEVIEAHLLFGVSYEQIHVVVHPQSVVHSMIECTDGATIAQLSLPDMRLPIGYALSYPERMSLPFGAIDWQTLGRLDFQVPDTEAFPCLRLAYEAGRTGGTATTCLNAANEVAVEAFLNGRLRWVDIPDVIENVLSTYIPGEPRDLDDVLIADTEARALAGSVVTAVSGRSVITGQGPAGA